MGELLELYLPYLTNLFGGENGTQTHDPLNANQVLYQLSYPPTNYMVD